MQKRLLQIVIAVAALVPISGGFLGVLGDPLRSAGFIGSQFSYLSGLLLGVGLCYWMLIANIERNGERLFLLTLIVVVGGFCRAVEILIGGAATPAVYACLIMELVVAPAVYLWQAQVARAATVDGAVARD